MRYPKDVRWTGVLQKLLGPEYNVIEEGCNGRTTIHDDPTEEWLNGLEYLRPCLKTHKPVDYIILMLGSNDLKTYFHLTAAEIADGAEVLVETIKSFAPTQQEYQPKIILVAPALIGDDLEHSPFNDTFDQTAVERSLKFAKEYKRVADETGCIFFDASKCSKASPIDSLHFTPESHYSLACEFAKLFAEI